MASQEIDIPHCPSQNANLNFIHWEMFRVCGKCCVSLLLLLLKNIVVTEYHPQRNVFPRNI
jgi:hypothetical protein